MSRLTIVEGNTNDKDNVRAIMVKGEKGDGVATIEKTSTAGLIDTYTITTTDGKVTTFTVQNGNGIASIEKTASVGLTDTYTINFTDGSSTTFNVTNGEMTKETTINVYDTVAEMKADETIRENTTCRTLGYYKINDGGGSTYQILNDYTLTDDGGSVISLNNNLFAKLIIDNEILNPNQFGCKGDGNTDDTTPFMNLLNYIYTNRYKRTIKLLQNNIYLLSKSIPVKHSLTIISDSLRSNPTIKNITTDMFSVSDDDCVNDNGTLKIWSYYFYNVNFVGARTTNIIKDNGCQHWGTKIENCSASGFGTLFNNIKLYASQYNNFSLNDIYSVGLMSGSDNIIQNSFWTGSQNEDDRSDFFINCNSLYLTRFINIFVTGSLSSGKGTKNLFNLYNCKDIDIDKCWLDYVDESAVNVELGEGINIINNMIRGISRIPSNTYSANIIIKASKGVRVEKNNYLNVHQGTQNESAKAFRIYDYTNNLCENITIQNNTYEIDFYYETSLLNGAKTKGIIINEPQLNMYYKSGVNILPDFSIDNTTQNGVTAFQDNEGNIILNGTTTGNMYLYLKGTNSSTDTLFALTANEKIQIKLNCLNPNVQLLLKNNTTNVINEKDGYETTIESDTDITSFAIYVPAYKTLNYVKVNPQLFLI